MPPTLHEAGAASFYLIYPFNAIEDVNVTRASACGLPPRGKTILLFSFYFSSLRVRRGTQNRKREREASASLVYKATPPLCKILLNYFTSLIERVKHLFTREFAILSDNFERASYAVRERERERRRNFGKTFASKTPHQQPRRLHDTLALRLPPALRNFQT